MNLYFTGLDPIGDNLHQVLTTAGWTCIHHPFRRVIYLDSQGFDPNAYDLLIITSIRAARWLEGLSFDHLPELAVVGRTTRKALTPHPVLFEADLPANADQLAQRLIQWLGKHEKPPRMCFLAGEMARPTLCQALSGWNLDTRTVYRTEKLEKRAATYQCGMVYFQAPSTVSDFLDAYGKPPEFVATIGPTTAAAVKARGWHIDFQPSRPELRYLGEELPNPRTYQSGETNGKQREAR